MRSWWTHALRPYAALHFRGVGKLVVVVVFFGAGAATGGADELVSVS